MKLNHLNLVVADVAESIAFFETYFGFRCASIKGDNLVAVLNGEDNFILVLMRSKNNDIKYPEAFHIGFMLDTTEKVEAVYQKLMQGNISIENTPAKIRDSFGFYFHFNNIMIEIGCSINK